MLYLMNFSHIVLSDEMLYFYGISSLLFIYVSIPAFILTVQQSRNKTIRRHRQNNSSTVRETTRQHFMRQLVDTFILSQLTSK